jgi:hypothetical protein
MRHTGLIAVAVVLLAACGGDTTGLVQTIADLAGAWDVSVWEYSLASDTTQKNDWVATQGLNGTLYIEPNGEFAMLVEFPWDFGRDYGTLSVQGDAIYWDGRGDEELVPFEVAGSTLNLHWPEEELVDVDRDGEPEDAWLRMVFESIEEPTRLDVSGDYAATEFDMCGGIGGGCTDVQAAGGSIELTLHVDATTAGRLFVPDLTGGGGPGFEADLAGTWIFYGTRLELDHPVDTFLREMVFAVEGDQLSAEWWDGMMDGYTIYVVLTKQ